MCQKAVFINGKVIPLLNRLKASKNGHSTLIGFDWKDVKDEPPMLEPHPIAAPFAIHSRTGTGFHLVPTIPTYSYFTLSITPTGRKDTKSRSIRGQRHPKLIGLEEA